MNHEVSERREDDEPPAVPDRPTNRESVDTDAWTAHEQDASTPSWTADAASYELSASRTPPSLLRESQEAEKLHTPEFQSWYDTTENSAGLAGPIDLPTGASRGSDSDHREVSHYLGRLAVDGKKAEDDLQEPTRDRPPPSWTSGEIRDFDVEQLRSLASSRDQFSDSRFAWVPVTAIEDTSEVRGESFKAGERTDRYAQDLGQLYDTRTQHGTVDSVDPRHTGDSRVRLCEDPDLGVLTITNGRHRVEAARQGGVPAVLAEVVVVRQAPTSRLPDWADGRTGDVTFGSKATDSSHRTFWTRDEQPGEAHQTTEVVDGKLRVRTHEHGWIEGWEEDLATGETERFRRRER